MPIEYRRHRPTYRLQKYLMPMPMAWAALAATLCAAPAQAALLWDWQYVASGVDARGTLTTADNADADGYYLVTGITGLRNGDSIVSLQPHGTAIPGNEPFAVDNLVRADGRLTTHGIGYATAGGTYANLFLASWLSPAAYVEFSSVPAVPSTAEVQVSFSVMPSSVPEPATFLMAALGGAALWLRRGRGAGPGRAADRRA
ncbi:PEP-CTERM sorting domain-containing protein [Aquincola sp. MAHUQ-54]|uniref:PEP-CTERM sorting domain-containing protein n=1 Tax=Aquincola agrisoli TaxID=3119538 RepID=A0AAW9QEE1_9BURK